MGFKKLASGEVFSFEEQFDHELKALNVPHGNTWDLYSEDFKKPLEKSAKMNKGTVDLNGFNIEAAIDENPDHLFVKVLAIKKDEVNENGDAFPEVELKKSAETFARGQMFKGFSGQKTSVGMLK